MPYAEDLLERRAVSTAYYALFHLLIHDATRNWKRAAQRPLLARGFDQSPSRLKAGKPFAMKRLPRTFSFTI
jgi:hypothetical protein